MLSERKLTFLRQMARALGKEFGENCEVALHVLDTKNRQVHLALLENGHVSVDADREAAAYEALSALDEGPEHRQDRLGYRIRLDDGRVLKASRIYLTNAEGTLEAVLTIRMDITDLLTVDHAIQTLIAMDEGEKNAQPCRIPRDVNELLDQLIEESLRRAGKPVALMTRDDKIKAIQFLDKQGAMLIKKSGDRIAKTFHISKYTLYSYIDAK